MSNGQTAIQLSKRELQVLEMVVTGASNQEIAQQLVISVNTVKVHMRNIFDKLGVQSRTEASLRAIQEGLVNVDAELEPAQRSTALVSGMGKNFISANPALALPRWPQFYLIAALLIALIFVVVPLLPKPKRTAVPDLPVIYSQPADPEPLSQPNGGSHRWVPHAPLPTSRAGLALVAFDGKIFAIGGVRGNNKATRTVEIYDPATDTFNDINGGNNMALGVFEDTEFKEMRREIAPGQIIVIATDGIWEARNPKGEMFSKDRIYKIIRQNASASANEIQNAILESLRHFQKEAPLEDDITLVVIKITD